MGFFDVLDELRPFLIAAAIIAAALWYGDESEKASLAASWYCDDTYGDSDDVREDVTLDFQGWCVLKDGTVRVKIPTREMRLRRKAIELTPGQ